MVLQVEKVDLSSMLLITGALIKDLDPPTSCCQMTGAAPVAAAAAAKRYSQADLSLTQIHPTKILLIVRQYNKLIRLKYR